MADPATPVRNGDHAHGLLTRQTKRLVELQRAVAGEPLPEALQEAERTLRRLAITLEQFAPALEIHGDVTPKRLAKTHKRLALACELDRLGQRLETGFLPQVPEREARRLKGVLRQLRKERQLAHVHLVDTLNGGSHLQMLALLQSWLRQPTYTALGDQPLAAWLPERAEHSARLLLHPGWWLVERISAQETLRGLGTELTASRERLRNLPAVGSGRHQAWLDLLQRGADLLEEHSDLALLRKAIDGQLRDDFQLAVPQLEWLLEQHQQQCWRQWRGLAQSVLAPERRRRQTIASLAGGLPASTPMGRLRQLLLRLAARIDT